MARTKRPKSSRPAEHWEIERKGFVQKPPSFCKFISKTSPIRETDIIFCAFHCEDQLMCHAYKWYRKALKEVANG